MIDLTNQKFGKLVVQKLAGRNGKHLAWSCVCECGNITRVQGGNLKNGHTKSCGCLNKEVIAERSTSHGHAVDGVHTTTYSSWSNMMTRCNNSTYFRYKDYGGRGIKVCDRWHKFENFLADMGERPEGTTLDRKDNDGDYCLENCRWATPKEQCNNTRRNVWIKYKGETKNVTQWAKSIGITGALLRQRLTRDGWSIERALTT
jgi:hypothetical protein